MLKGRSCYLFRADSSLSRPFGSLFGAMLGDLNYWALGISTFLVLTVYFIYLILFLITITISIPSWLNIESSRVKDYGAPNPFHRCPSPCITYSRNQQTRREARRPCLGQSKAQGYSSNLCTPHGSLGIAVLLISSLAARAGPCSRNRTLLLCRRSQPHGFRKYSRIPRRYRDAQSC